MSGGDIKRAMYLRDLFEQMLAKTNPKLDHKVRHIQAAKLMDKKLGKEWRAEINRPRLEIIEVETVTPAPKDHDLLERFYDRVLQVGHHEEGLGYEGSDAPREGDRADEATLKDRVMCAVSKVLDKVL